jgi:hypothetical protein
MKTQYLWRRSHLPIGTEPPPTKVEGISGLERLRRTVGPFPTEVGGFKPDLWKMKCHADKQSKQHNWRTIML